MPIIVTDEGSLSRALTTSLDLQLKRLLTDRIEQLDFEDLTTAASFVIVRPGDTIADLEQALSFSVFQNLAGGTRLGDPDFTPGWEWIEDHGFCFELVFIFTDDGFAHVVFVPSEPGIDASLLNLCSKYCGEQAVC